MANGIEPKPPGGAEKSLGEIVADITAKLQLLVKEEIELAKTEITIKAKKLGTGAGMAVGAVVTLIYFSIFFFFSIAYLLNDLFFEDVPFLGFMVVAVFFLILTVILVLVGVRLIKKGSPPAPEMAIEEAKATKVALEEAID